VHLVGFYYKNKTLMIFINGLKMIELGPNTLPQSSIRVYTYDISKLCLTVFISFLEVRKDENRVHTKSSTSG